MRSVAEHTDRVLELAQASAPLEVNLLGAVGCVLAQDVVVDDGETREVLLTKGMVITARHIALIAAAGLARVWVHPRPRVVILTVGDDLGEPGEGDLRPDINGLSLTAAANAAGAMSYRVGPLASDDDIVRTSIEDQLVRADIIVAACGMSARDYDLVTRVLKELGSVEFVRVSMQPGGAQGFGRIGPDSTPIFVLPANPVGALLSFDLFVRPLMRRLMGHVAIHHRTSQMSLGASIERHETNAQYVRARVHVDKGRLTATSTEDPENPVSGLGSSDSLIVIEPGSGAAPAGASVTVIRLEPEGDQ